MPELSTRESIEIQQLFEDKGYVLDFTNDSFRAFVFNATGIDIYEPDSERYDGLSKARRLRTFLQSESSYSAGKLLTELLECAEIRRMPSGLKNRDEIIARLRITATRLLHESPIDNLDAVEALSD